MSFVFLLVGESAHNLFSGVLSWRKDSQKLPRRKWGSRSLQENEGWHQLGLADFLEDPLQKYQPTAASMDKHSDAMMIGYHTHAHRRLGLGFLQASLRGKDIDVDLEH